jgi:hypothetical protein
MSTGICPDHFLNKLRINPVVVSFFFCFFFSFFVDMLITVDKFTATSSSHIRKGSYIPGMNGAASGYSTSPRIQISPAWPALLS